MKRIFLILLSLILLGFSKPPPADKTNNADIDKFAAYRTLMVENQLARRGITDKRVLDAMRKIPRHLFVDKDPQSRAYGDHPLPIGEGQTISQPFIVAWMTELLKLKDSDRVLEIGTGSGYQAAVLAEIVKEAYTIEIRERLKKRASELLSSLGYKNIQTKYGDGYFGWDKHAPFDKIVITASANHIPPPLIRQLKEGGKLIIPLGSTLYFQTLTIVTKKGDDLEVEQMGGVAFVPMVGEMRNQTKR